MKKDVTICIDEEIWAWMKKNFINKSAWMNALAIKEYNKSMVNHGNI